MTQDELNGKVARLARCKANPEVKFYLECIKEMADNLIIQDYNAKGVEAVRSLGVQKGLGIAQKIEEIYSSQLSAMTQAQIIKPR
jgi:hypothetical protein